jgi:hypothetical protein
MVLEKTPWSKPVMDPAQDLTGVRALEQEQVQNRDPAPARREVQGLGRDPARGLKKAQERVQDQDRVSAPDRAREPNPVQGPDWGRALEQEQALVRKQDPGPDKAPEQASWARRRSPRSMSP